jgi:hypothetical protein
MSLIRIPRRQNDARVGVTTLRLLPNRVPFERRQNGTESIEIHGLDDVGVKGGGRGLKLCGSKLFGDIWAGPVFFQERLSGRGSRYEFLIMSTASWAIFCSPVLKAKRAPLSGGGAPPMMADRNHLNSGGRFDDHSI